MAAKANSKAKDKRPARTNYWTRRHLVRNKVKRMMRAFGLTEAAATKRWHAERKGRTVKGVVNDLTQGEASTHNKKKKGKKDDLGSAAT